MPSAVGGHSLNTDQNQATVNDVVTHKQQAVTPQALSDALVVLLPSAVNTEHQVN